MTTLTSISGDGRGKTSLVMGHLYQKFTPELSVLVAQFLKTGTNCGECQFFKTYKNINWLYFGKEEFYHNEKRDEFSEIIQEGIKQVKEIVMTTQIDILILDEIGVALFFELINWEEVAGVLRFVKDETIITGRKIPKNVLQQTNNRIIINEIKHPYTSGIQARKGIDY